MMLSVVLDGNPLDENGNLLDKVDGNIFDPVQEYHQKLCGFGSWY